MKATGNNSSNQRLHLLLLLCWLAVGLGLRFVHLNSKPPWSDEWATIVFSLGHSFSVVPLDRPVSLETILLPLQLDPSKGVGDVVRNLMNDSTHPPLYFMLSHWWLKLFSPPEGLVSIWLARSLSALLGAASVPAMFGLGWLVFRSRLVGQVAAALMAVSPYGIYLAQEARHYTLAILWLIASLGCFMAAVRRYPNSLPVWIVLVWVGANSLGIATHYFFGLALAAQFLVLLGLWLRELKQRSFLTSYWLRIYAAIVGTLAGTLVWLPALQRIPGNSLTSWIYEGSNLFDAIARLLAWVITMFFLLPVEGTPAVVTVLSGAAVLLVLLWLAPILVRGWQVWQQSSRLPIQILSWFIVASIALIGSTNLLGADLTVAARFQFTYFPAIVLLLGAILSKVWRSQAVSSKSSFGIFQVLHSRGKLAVVVTLTMGLLGGLTVISNFGYQKFERPDLMVSTIVAAQNPASSEPILIATDRKSHGQTAEMMGLAWQFQQLHNQQYANSSIYSPRTTQAPEVVRQSGLGRGFQGAEFISAHSPLGFPQEELPFAQRLRRRYPFGVPAMRPPQFLLISNKDSQQTQVLREAIAQFPRLQLWLVNSATSELEMPCTADSNFEGKVPGYRYRLYRCSAIVQETY